MFKIIHPILSLSQVFLQNNLEGHLSVASSGLECQPEHGKMESCSELLAPSLWPVPPLWLSQLRVSLRMSRSKDSLLPSSMQKLLGAQGVYPGGIPWWFRAPHEVGPQEEVQAGPENQLKTIWLDNSGLLSTWSMVQREVCGCLTWG